jgi:hypothetical protein
MDSSEVEAFQDLLEIWIPTYNRADKLKWILEDLSNSELASCTITISDNASTDDTEAVCKAHQASLPNMHYKKLEFNIGANANILDGFRHVKAPYFWIVCDDDRLFLNGFREQFIRFAKLELAAILLVGDPFRKQKSDPLMGALGGQVVPISRALAAFGGLVSTMSFLPSVIYRRSALSSRMLYWGYSNCAFLYPHMPLISELVNQDAEVGVFERVVVQAGFDVPPFSAPKRYWLAWCHSCRFLADPAIQRQSKWSVLGGASFRSWLNVVRNLLLWDLVCPSERYHTLGPLTSFPREVHWAYLFGSICTAPLRLVPRQFLIAILKSIFPAEKLRFLEKVHEFAS